MANSELKFATVLRNIEDKNSFLHVSTWKSSSFGSGKDYIVTNGSLYGAFVVSQYGAYEILKRKKVDLEQYEEVRIKIVWEVL